MITWLGQAAPLPPQQREQGTPVWIILLVAAVGAFALYEAATNPASGGFRGR